MSGLLIIGHGTRHEGGKAEFLETANMLADRMPAVVVQPCFLELAEPTLLDGVTKLVSSGVSQIVAVPLLLFAAGHWKRDVPAQLNEVTAQHPNLQVNLARHLGNHPALIDLSVQRFNEAVAAHNDAFDLAKTTLILVGRGSGDQSATAEMIEFARLRAEHTPVARHLTCFLAMAQPSVSETFDAAHSGDSRQVVVQPHLLFQGELCDDLRAKVAQQNRASADQKWIMTEPLGPADQLVRAIIDRLAETRFDDTG